MHVQEEHTIINGKLFSCIKDLNNAFMSVFDRPFFLEYGSNYDRIKILLSAEPEVIAKVLKLRPDLDESSLNRCIITAKRAIEMLTNENICRNPPHASSIEGHIIELAYFLQRLHNQREHIRAQFAPEGFRVHFDRIFSEEYLRYEKYLYDNGGKSINCPVQKFFHFIYCQVLTKYGYSKNIAK